MTALYDALAERLFTGDLARPSRVAETLLTLDRVRAHAFLTSPEVFKLDNPALLDILMPLDSAECTVPPSILVPMMPALLAWSDGADKLGRTGAAYEVALAVLARSDLEAARPLAEAALRSGDEYRRKTAAEVLAIVARVDDALSVVEAAVDEWTDEDGIDFGELGAVRTNYYLAHEADEMIRHEGLRGYLLETPDQNLARASAALKAIGAPLAAESVRKAYALFKKARKLKPRAGERSLIEVLHRPELSAQLESLHAPFIDPERREKISTLLGLYAISNPPEFQAPKKRSRRR